MTWVRNVLALLVVVAAGSWAYYTNVVAKPHAMDMSARVTGAASAFPVTLATVEQGAVRGTVVYTGSVAAYNEEDVYARVTGRILEMSVYPGDAVKAGQVVARLDDLELTSRVHEADAAAASAHANRAQMDADLAASRYGDHAGGKGAGDGRGRGGVPAVRGRPRRAAPEQGRGVPAGGRQHTRPGGGGAGAGGGGASTDRTGQGPGDVCAAEAGGGRRHRPAGAGAGPDGPGGAGLRQYPGHDRRQRREAPGRARRPRAARARPS